MSTHIDPVPREARPFQGHRAGLVTRAAAGAIDLGILIIALGVLPRGLRISLSSRTPQLHRLRRHRLDWCMPSARCCSFFISRCADG